MAVSYSVTLQKIVDEFKIEVVYAPCELTEIKISCVEINRPGLELIGFMDYFDEQRLQVIGKKETAYLEQLNDEAADTMINEYLILKPPAMIFTKGQQILPKMLEAAKKYAVPLLRTNEGTSYFMSTLISFLNFELAPRITRHGVLVEVLGEGILIVGESGVGKTETAVELMMRGHRLIADDAVEIRRISSKTLIGTSPANIRHYMELRGVGIINARQLFGVGSVKVAQKIDFIIQLESWDIAKIYDRLGIDNEFSDIFGIQVPVTTIPIKPGRNLAVIIETASMNNRHKRMGYNAGAELLLRLEQAGAYEGNDIDWNLI